ncbi:O-antigen ligase family protein [Pleomorphovibrio marinus]|uniref:O-antigen ligase family protein n=1 Tax=Pleomorphovibrio marinus TaxID=2164132 RepID=UPI000E0B36D1|nr:O-antigen ligase family protein [Pleomorphovibrio marinus]
MEVIKTNKGGVVLLASIAVAGFSVFVVVTGMLGIAALFVLPVAIFFLYWVIQNPSRGLDVTLVCAFVSIGAIRYLNNIPLGLSVDFALFMGVISAIFQSKAKVDFQKTKNSLLLVTMVWVFYNIAQLANPEARSLSAWVYAVRGTALYMLLTIPLTLLYANKNKDLNRFFRIIFAFSLLAAFWGLRQYYVGLDAAENRWLDQGSRSTHILFGNLRVFSFFSDAGQFGAGIAHMGIIVTILALGPFSKRLRMAFGGMAVLFFVMMALSGTRGALVVPVGGMLAYLFASKNFKIMLLGLVALGIFVAFLKFSTIGNDVYQVRRLRSALDPQDASLNVRKVNQQKFAIYLANRPFGGGIGTSGYWGQRFSPGTFLAETPNDSWFVKIWAEMGVVGLILHLGILAYIGLMALFKIWKVKNPKLKQKLLALFAGYVGILLSSYGNPILGQMPTGIIIYMSMAYFYLAPHLDHELETKKNA